ncbi:hypothetical protein M758_3G212000 [Ceratodon purpureus]|nr:hypothetical protein M758_3G212000 [Ceratodon purpureus]
MCSLQIRHPLHQSLVSSSAEIKVSFQMNYKRFFRYFTCGPCTARFWKESSNWSYESSTSHLPFHLSSTPSTTFSSNESRAINFKRVVQGQTSCRTLSSSIR